MYQLFRETMNHLFYLGVYLKYLAILPLVVTHLYLYQE